MSSITSRLVGSVATLSRNFQLSCLQPFIGRDDVELVLRSGSLSELLAQLKAHTLDVVLSNLPVKREASTDWHSYLLEKQPVALVGKKRRGKKFSYPDDLKETPLLLPTLDTNLRVSFDLVMERQGVRPIIAAEIDDMAMMRLLARDGAGVALVPPVVVTGELKREELIELHRFPDIFESFYAIAPSRKTPNPLVQEMIKAQQDLNKKSLSKHLS